jgi:exodeoxyribonuclease V beta subunit
MSELAALDVANVPLSGVTLIEASAGTGKTYTLAALFVRCLLERELNVTQILVVTYTRAASAELRVRIRERIGAAIDALDGIASSDLLLREMASQARDSGQGARKRARLIDALRSFDEAPIYTIHGFCQRVLRRHAFESGVGFDAELSEDHELLVEEVVSDFWANRLDAAAEDFVAALDKHGLDIAALVGLVQRARPNPSLRILPRPAPLDLSEPTRAFASARQRALQLWAAESDAVQRLLEHPGMHASYYNRSKVFAEYPLQLAAADGAGPYQAPKCLKYLSSAGLVTKKSHAPPRHAFFDACAEWEEAAAQLRAALDQHVYAFVHEALEYARLELTRRADEAGRLGFDDLMLRLADALAGPDAATLAAAIRSSYPVALIDEFQDTDPLQCDVFRRLYAAGEGGSLMLIGDPKQAIYAFRGADVFAYMAAARDSVDRAYTLGVNYRSDPSLLCGLGALFGRARLPFVFPEIEHRSVAAAPGARAQIDGPSLEFLLVTRGESDKALTRAAAEESIPQRMAAELCRLFESGQLLAGAPIEPRHVAVLCRTNQQALTTQKALRERGIPAVLDGDASVFDSDMAEELGRWLWAMVEPADPARLRAALATSGLGVSGQRLLELESDEAGWDGWVAHFHELQELWQTRGFMRALRQLCDSQNVAQRLLARPDGERRYTDLMHLAELLHAEALRTRKGPRALLDCYRRWRSGAGERAGMALDDVQIRLESDARAVTLLTIHKSKGLEFPIVYCPFSWGSAKLHPSERKRPQFHDRGEGDRATLLLGDPSSQQLMAAEQETLAEQLRLLYVALTRARHRLAIVWGAIADFESSALAYLLHQGQGENAEALQADTIARVKTLSDSAIAAELADFAAADGCEIAIRPLADAGSAGDFRPRLRHLQPLAAREARPSPGQPWHIGSFSALAASDSQASPAEPEGLDRDAAATPSSAASEPASALGMAAFPSGAGFGHLIHSIYERIDFRVGAADELGPVVAEALAEYGAEANWNQPLSAAIYASLHTPLSAADAGLPMLASVGSASRLCELEFVVPVGTGASGSALTNESLARTLRAHASHPATQRYAARLQRLRFAPLRGGLRGFVDLVVEHAGLYYVLDYKSNLIGPLAQDYRPERLEPVMHRHHYVLQYLLYSVALHRYLGLRLPGYDYDQHFGGVYYLFVRGMHPSHPLGTGVFHERPERGLIEALSELLQAGR